MNSLKYFSGRQKQNQEIECNRGGEYYMRLYQNSHEVNVFIYWPICGLL